MWTVVGLLTFAGTPFLPNSSGFLVVGRVMPTGVIGAIRQLDDDVDRGWRDQANPFLSGMRRQRLRYSNHCASRRAPDAAVVAESHNRQRSRRLSSAAPCNLDEPLSVRKANLVLHQAMSYAARRNPHRWIELHERASAVARTGCSGTPPQCRCPRSRRRTTADPVHFSTTCRSPSPARIQRVLLDDQRGLQRHPRRDVALAVRVANGAGVLS